MAGSEGSLKSILYALTANFTIAIAKGVAAVITHSGAMLAEAIHSLADCSNQLLLLLGMKLAKRPLSPQYPLGYGKEIYFWSFIVALMLFSVGGMFSIYEGIHKLQEPQQLNKPYIAIGVLVFAIIAEGLSLFGCMKEVNKVRGDMSYLQWFRRSRQSALLVIFGEDLAALIGLVFALIAIFITMATGNPIYDAFGTLSIGVLLIIVAIMIGMEVKALLIGQGVEQRKRTAMIESLEAHPHVEKIYNLLTLQLGDDVMVAVKARMTPCESAQQLIDNINSAEKIFREAYPEVMWLFFEPDTHD